MFDQQRTTLDLHTWPVACCESLEVARIEPERVEWVCACRVNTGLEHCVPSHSELLQ